jgi:hypothetical protein
MQVHYLETVTPEVDATCEALAELHGVTFSQPEAGLGNSRVELPGYGTFAIHFQAGIQYGLRQV